MQLQSISSLEAAYGRQLDRLTWAEQQALARRAFRDHPFLLTAFDRRGVRAPLWRPRLLRELARQHGGDMSTIELRLLQAIRAMGPVTISALARAVEIPRLVVYGHAYRMRRRGLIFQSSNGYDVTEAGRSIVDLSWHPERQQESQQRELFEV